MVKWLGISWFGYCNDQNKGVHNELESLRLTCLTDFNISNVLPDTKQKHDPYELVCFDAYDKQIVRFVRYLTVLPSL